MEEKDYITNKAELSSLTKTYSEKDLDAKGVFQKLGRKMTSWYINPFGDSQNEFNKNVVKSFDDASSSLEEMNKKIQTLETKLSAVVQQNDALKTRINKLQQGEVAILDGCINSIEKSNKELNDYIRSVSPEKRKSVSALNGCKEINEMIYLQLSNGMTSQSKEPITLEEWGKLYKSTLKKELENMGISYANRIIVIICKDFISSQGMNSTCSEAFELYMLLKKSSSYNIKFISIEGMLNRPLIENDILCLPEKNFGQYLNAINPMVCIFCDNSLSIAQVDNGSVLNYKSIFKISGQNPLIGTNDDTIKELTYLNDLGLHQYLVQSQKAYDILLNKGFHEPTIVLPVTNKNKIYTKTRTFNKDNFTVGFTSSPIKEDLIPSRGVNLLCDLVKAMPNVNFEILWKYDDVSVPEELKSLENCKVSLGRQNMQQFYSNIDCLLVPFTNDNNNAYTLTSIEAMKNGIPVVCTDVSGVSELINYCYMGEVSTVNCDGLVKSIEKIINNYESYTNPINILRLNAKLDTYNIVDIIEKTTERFLKVKPITLKDWQKSLKDNKKDLIIGTEKVINFCKDTNNFKKYLENKYTPDILKCLDFIQLQNMGTILEDRFENAKLKILNVTFGDTNINKEYSKYGDCTSTNALLDSIDGKYNVITCFRYLSYLNYSDRKTLYKKLLEHLSQNGIILMDIPNIIVDITLKNTLGWQNCNLFEVAWTKESIIEELKNNGFKIQYIIPVGQSMMTNLPDNVKKLPISWTIGVLKD